MCINVTKEFAVKLQSLIIESGKSIKQLAVDIGVPSGSLSKYQNNAAEPGINSLYKIADYFHVSADYLLGITDQRTSNIDDKAIHETIGLSDKAIEKLKGYKKYLPGVLIPVLSELIECEAEPDALSLREKYSAITTITDEERQGILDHYEDEASHFPYPENEDDPFVYVPEFWEGPLLLIAEYFESVVDEEGSLRIKLNNSFVHKVDAQEIIDTVILDQIKNVLIYTRCARERSKVNAEIRYEKYANTLEEVKLLKMLEKSNFYEVFGKVENLTKEKFLKVFAEKITENSTSENSKIAITGSDLKLDKIIEEAIKEEEV
nr:helix-turn-helix transcriptional regulator [uncultured Acetobacterium sp.]